MEPGQVDHEHVAIHLERFPLDKSQVKELAPTDIYQGRLGQDKLVGVAVRERIPLQLESGNGWPKGDLCAVQVWGSRFGGLPV